MKVSIVTEGYHNTGYGHITRCLSIYQAFEARNIIPTFYVNGDEACKDFLNDANYEIIDWIENQQLLFRKIQDSDVVIIDSYKAPKDFYDHISQMTPSPVYLDDNRRLDYPSGIILNGGINAETLGYPKRDGLTLMLGPRFTPLRKEFWEAVEKQIRIEIQSVLITFGGQDVQNLTPRMIRIFSRNFPEFRKKIIIGSGFTNKDQIEEAKDESTELFFSPPANELVKIMADCDLAISAGGQTINELARLGIPTIAIAVADNQVSHLGGWLKEKFLLMELTYTQPNLESRLLLVLNHLKKKPARDAVSKIGKQKIDGAGSKRVVQFLVEKTAGKAGYYFRTVIAKDASMIFNLSNDRLVRANSIQQESINWGNHLDWFSGKLLDDDCYFLVAFTTTDQFIGQIRFEIKGYYAEINISIDKDFRGKDLAKSLIFNASYRCFHLKPNVGHILAFIRPQNTPSIKAFSKAGYLPFQKEKINDEEYFVLKLKR
jgi:UDP-2,4-diacetamido-2,4,6-trideoxy-beta-L-altropyranose hydrolase